MPHTRVPVRSLVHAAGAAALILITTATARAQTTPTPAQDVIPVAAPLPTEADLNIINLPTTLSLARHKGYFRLTHRFARDLGRGTLGELAADLFSLDNGAVIGFEYRYAITGNIHAGANRTMLSKTIQTFVRWDALRQGTSLPVSISVTGSYEGLNNMRDHYQPGVMATVSRTFGDRVALYATPGFVARTHAVDVIAGHDHDHTTGLAEDEHSHHQDTWFAGLGGRLRVQPTVYVSTEYTPRLHGYDPNTGAWGIAIEKRTGGHLLQLNLTNTFATTPGQLARGGNQGQVFLGFNITRRF